MSGSEPDPNPLLPMHRFTATGTSRPTPPPWVATVFRRSRAAATITLLVVAMAGCTGNSHLPYDEFGAYNMLGGSHRTNDFSHIPSTPVGTLIPIVFKDLHGGFLAPPLELSGGRMAAISRSDTGATLVIILRDSILHRHPFREDEHPMATLAADSAGTIYSITTRGRLQAFDDSGTLLWEKESFAGIPADQIVIPTSLLALSDGVLVGNTDGRLARYDRSGRMLWGIQRGGSLGTIFAASPAVGAAIGITHNDYDLVDSVSVVDPATGAAIWTRPIVEGRIIYGPVLAGGLIVLGVAQRGEDMRRMPSLVAFRSNGTMAWRTPLMLMPRGIAGDREGTIYVSCAGVAETANGGALLAIDTAGRKQWEVNLESDIPAPALISAEWIYFIARRDGRTGLFTYSRDGIFHSFISVHLVPDVLALMTLNSYGEPIMAGFDQPAIIRGG